MANKHKHDTPTPDAVFESTAEALKNPGMTEQESLRDRMKEAVANEDWKAVAKVSADLTRLEKETERTAREAAESAVKELSFKVKDAITALITPMIENKELDGCDGVWYGMDFGDLMESGLRPASIKLLKSAAKTPRAIGGGGGGKRFDKSWKEFLDQYGNDLVTEADAKYRSAVEPFIGQTWKEAYESSTNGNFRYHIRECWLHKDGSI